MIILEGTIGAGKTTFLEQLQSYLPTYMMGPEPLQDWHQPKNGPSLLECFYSDPQRWAYTLETLTLMSRVRDYQRYLEQYGTRYIVERSVFSGQACFARNSYESGYLNEIEWQSYNNWYNFLLKKHALRPQGFIYLRVDPECAYQRIKKRNRPGESAVTLEYLTRIGTLHDEFLLRPTHDIPVMVLDGSIEFQSQHDIMQELAQQVTHFITQVGEK